MPTNAADRDVDAVEVLHHLHGCQQEVLGFELLPMHFAAPSYWQRPLLGWSPSGRPKNTRKVAEVAFHVSASMPWRCVTTTNLNNARGVHVMVVVGFCMVLRTMMHSFPCVARLVKCMRVYFTWRMRDKRLCLSYPVLASAAALTKADTGLYGDSLWKAPAQSMMCFGLVFAEGATISSNRLSGPTLSLSVASHRCLVCRQACSSGATATCSRRTACW